MEFIKQAFEQDQAATGGRLRIGSDQRGGGPGSIHTPIVELDPHVLARNRIVAHVKTDPKTAPFDMLRTRVLREMALNNWRTLAITSPSPDSGKTLTAINLAFSVSYSMTNTALLVDFDLRRPNVAKYLGLPNELPSIVDCFNSGAGIEDVLISPGFKNFALLPNFQAVENSAETLGSDRASELILELRERYLDRVVIFDLPPLLEVDDTLSILPKVDCVLLVVAAGQSTANEIKECRRLLKPYNLIGTVLNKSDAETNDYY